MREHCVPMNSWYRFLLWLLLLVWVNRLVVRAETTANTDTDSEDNDKYLYHTEEARGIIIDYEPPPTTNDGGAKDEDPHGDRPDFIYGPNQGPRVVEFYAPWCPHVRSFVRSFARSTTRVDVTIQMANAKICTTHGAPLLFICIFDITSANIFAVITSSLRNR